MSDEVLIAIITATPPTLVGIISLIVSLRNAKKIESVHKTINSGKTIEIAASRELGNAEGRLAEQQKQK
jgi:hypothetical protein